MLTEVALSPALEAMAEEFQPIDPELVVPSSNSAYLVAGLNGRLVHTRSVRRRLGPDFSFELFLLCQCSPAQKERYAHVVSRSNKNGGSSGRNC
jgi:hypothetical protein